MSRIRRDIMVESHHGDAESFQEALRILDDAADKVWKLGFEVRVIQKLGKQRDFSTYYIPERKGGGMDRWGEEMKYVLEVLDDNSGDNLHDFLFDITERGLAWTLKYYKDGELVSRDDHTEWMERLAARGMQS